MPAMTRLIIIAITPGIIAYTMGSILIAWPGGADLFSEMAPANVPHGLAILAEQIWLSGAGLALIAAASWDGFRKWRGGE